MKATRYQIKILAIFLVSAILFTNCNNPSERSKTYSMNNEVKNKNTREQTLPQDFGKNYAAAWSGQDAPAHTNFFSSNGSQTVNNGTPAVGHDAIAKVAQGFMDAFPNMFVTCDSLPTTSKGVEFHWTLTGTNTGPGGSGKKVHISGVEILQFDSNGLITISNGSFDEKEYDRQLKYGAAD